MDPIIGGALISGGANLLGGLFQGNSSVKAQKLANESNLQIARENNQWNRENMQLQNDWNLQQWYRENEYNSASAQAQRFREAGLNPYLAMTGGANAGSASSVTSADPGQASEVGRQMPIDYSAYGGVLQTLRELPLQIAQAESLGASTDKQEAEADVARATAEQLGIENFYKSHIMRLTTEKMIQDLDIGDTYKKQMLVHLDDMQRENALLSDYEVNDARKQQYIQGVRLTASSAALSELNHQIAEKHYKWFDEMMASQIAKTYADAAAASAAAGLSRQQTKLVMEQTALAAFENLIRKGLKIKDINELRKSMVSSAIGTANKSIGEGRYYLEFGNRADDFIGSQIFGNYAGAGASVANSFLKSVDTFGKYKPLKLKPIGFR